MKQSSIEVMPMNNSSLQLPSLDQIARRWVALEIARTKPFELSHAVLATAVGLKDIQSDNQIKVAKVAHQFASFRVNAVSQNQQALEQWRELWELVALELCEKLDSHLRVGWENRQSSTDDSETRDSNQVICFRLSASPAQAPVFLAIKLELNQQLLVARTEKLSSISVSTGCRLLFAKITVPAGTIEQVSIGGLFVFGVSRAKSGTLKVGFCLHNLAKPLFSMDWNLDAGEVSAMSDIDLTNLEQDEISKKTSFSVQRSGKAMEIPVYAYIELPAMPFNELQSIQSDQILQTNLRLENCIVSLSTDSQTFAQGQLIEINGQVAVRVTKIGI